MIEHRLYDVDRSTRPMGDNRYAWVEYTVPVLAKVDLIEGTVERVVLLDEETRPTGKVYIGEEPIGEGDAPSPETKRAADIAESEWWPVWESGF